MEEASGPPIEVFEDNLATVQVFMACGTQWRVGPSGPTGMDYASVLTVMQLTGVPKAQWRDVFEGVRTMEDAALEKIRENIKNQT